MARILHIDTSAAKSIIMLSEGGKVITLKNHDGERDGAAVVNRLIGEALTDAGWDMNRIAAVAVCTGPGSYTGVRIALSTAKGFAYALDIPIIAHDRLQLGLLFTMALYPAKDLLVAIIPARVGEYFIAARAEDMVLPPSLMTTGQVNDFLASYAQNKIAVWGTHADDLGPLLGKVSDSVPYPDLDTWGAAAYMAYLENHFEDAARLEPAYLKEVFIHTSSTRK